jgi:hypothetical protein
MAISGHDVDKVKAYEAVLECLKGGGLLAEAASAAKVSTTALWNWRKADAVFAVRCEQAIEAGCDKLEDVLYQGAAKAAIDPAFWRHLAFVLTNRRPHKWKHLRNLAMISEVKITFPDLPNTGAGIGVEARKALLQNRLAALTGGNGNGNHERN